MSSAAPSVAVLDDEENMRIALRRLLGPRGYEVTLFETGAELVSACAERAFQCVVLDLHMPGMSGFDVLARLAEQGQPPPVIIITGHDQAGNEERARQLGASAYLTKPFDSSPFLKLVAELCQGARGGGKTG